MHVELSQERLSKVQGSETLVTVYRQGDEVYKFAPSFLTPEWKERMTAVLLGINIPIFIRFIEGGYVTRYLDGIDLMGDGPFLWRFNEDHGWLLTDKQRQDVINIFADIVFAGEKTGFYLADFTRRNMMLAEDCIYLIDYDVVITKAKVMDTYIPIWQGVLDWLNVKHTFRGDTNALLSALYKEAISI